METALRSAAEIALMEIEKTNLQGEAYLLYNRELTIETAGGKLETLKQAEEMGIGIRVFNRGRIGFSYSSNLSRGAITETVKDAITISAYTDMDPYNELPSSQPAYPDVFTYDHSINDMDLETKIEMANSIETHARGFDPRVVLVDHAGYADSEHSKLVMNSHGLYAYGIGSHCGLHISLAAREGDDIQNGFAFTINKRLDKLTPRTVGEEAALRAIRSLKAKAIASVDLPCILEPYVVTRFLNLLIHSVQADAVQKGKSILSDKIDCQVASHHVTLFDDPLSAEGASSFPFDGEGVTAQRVEILEQGILKGFLYDTYTGLKDGHGSNGHGERGSFRSLPGVGSTNLILSPGVKTAEELISDANDGFYVTDIMGMHTANPISGDFSIGAAGIRIENGALTYPVRGVTIAGNLFGMLKDIEAVGSDLRFFGGKAAGTVLVKKLSIAGS